MSAWLDTEGLSLLAVAICDRCKMKRPLIDMYSDPNQPGVFACIDCIDEFDPWRLPARESEDITIPHPRPDLPLVVPVTAPIGTNLGWTADSIIVTADSIIYTADAI